MAAPLTPADPTRLGDYEVLARLGTGGQGTVYLATDTTTKVAIKLLHTKLLADANARARFVRELALLQRVAGFCTAQMLEADLAGDRPYIVSEYVPGPSLRELVQTQGPRSGADLDRLAIHSMTALTAIHRAGIVHRDFKPQNVLMGSDGPRVIDFGIAKALEPGATLTSQVVGTPAYMAPEQFTGTQVGPSADLHAWAVTLLYAATGRDPFAGGGLPAVFYRIMNETPPLDPLPPQIAEVAAACLSKEPQARPSSEEALMWLLGQHSPPGHQRHRPSPGTQASPPPLGGRDQGEAPDRGAPSPPGRPASSDREPAQGSAPVQDAPYGQGGPPAQGAPYGAGAAPGQGQPYGGGAPGHDHGGAPVQGGPYGQGPAGAGERRGPSPQDVPHGEGGAPNQGAGPAGPGEAPDWPAPYPPGGHGPSGSGYCAGASEHGGPPAQGGPYDQGGALGELYGGGAPGYGVGPGEVAPDWGAAYSPGGPELGGARPPAGLYGEGGAPGQGGGPAGPGEAPDWGAAYPPGGDGPGVHGGGYRAGAGEQGGAPAQGGPYNQGGPYGQGGAPDHGQLYAGGAPGQPGEAPIRDAPYPPGGHGPGARAAGGYRPGSGQGVGRAYAAGSFGGMRRTPALVVGLILAGLLAALDVAELGILVAQPSLAVGVRGELLPPAVSYTVLAMVTLVGVVLGLRGSRAATWVVVVVGVLRILAWAGWSVAVAVNPLFVVYAGVSAVALLLLMRGLWSGRAT